jgi:hypothetical protein
MATKGNSSQLEYAVLTKGGSTLVQGIQSNGKNWSKLISYHLLAKCIRQSEKYATIIILAFDIAVDEIRNFISVVSQEIAEGQSRISYEHLIESGKLIIYTNWEEFYRSERAANQISSSNSHRVIFLLSLSELLLCSSNQRARMHELTQLIQMSNHSTRFSGDFDCHLISLIACIYTTVHSNSLISHLRSIFPTNIFILPNDGTMSSEVAVELQITRRSTISSKVNESTEMYRFDKSKFLLTAILKQNAEDFDQGSSGERSSQTSSEKLQGGVASFSPSAVSNHASVSIIPEKPSTVASFAANLTKGKLITFDSTDPDFDDDSDPDADLDL